VSSSTRTTRLGGGGWWVWVTLLNLTVHKRMKEGERVTECTREKKG